MSLPINKSKITKFNFSEADWESVPNLLTSVQKQSLTKEEQHLYKAIKFAYFTNEAGREEINKKVARISLMGLISLICLISLLSLATRFDKENITGTVNAATISATFQKIQKGDGLELLESTMSAMFNPK